MLSLGAGTGRVCPAVGATVFVQWIRWVIWIGRLVEEVCQQRRVWPLLEPPLESLKTLVAPGFKAVGNRNPTHHPFAWPRTRRAGNRKSSEARKARRPSTQISPARSRSRSVITTATSQVRRSITGPIPISSRHTGRGCRGAVFVTPRCWAHLRDTLTTVTLICGVALRYWNPFCFSIQINASLNRRLNDSGELSDPHAHWRRFALKSQCSWRSGSG